LGEGLANFGGTETDSDSGLDFSGELGYLSAIALDRYVLVLYWSYFEGTVVFDFVYFLDVL